MDRWAGELSARGVAPGARVMLSIADPLAFAVAHLAVIAAGRCSAPVDPAAPPAEAARARALVAPALVLTDRADRALPGAATGALPTGALPTGALRAHCGRAAGRCDRGAADPSAETAATPDADVVLVTARRLPAAPVGSPSTAPPGRDRCCC